MRENGSLPLVDSAVKIAQALNVSVEYLVNGEDGMTNSKSVQANQTDEISRLTQNRNTNLPEWKKTLIKNICDIIKKLKFIDFTFTIFRHREMRMV